jgi:hypothetical protein
MAETVGEFITGAEWRLLCDIRAFVATFCGGPDAAEALVLAFARQKHFGRGYRWHDPEPEYGGIGVSPADWGISNGFVDIPVDFDASSVMVLYHLPGRLPERRYRMLLVRLHRDDVLSMLRLARLLSPEAAQRVEEVEAATRAANEAAAAHQARAQAAQQAQARAAEQVDGETAAPSAPARKARAERDRSQVNRSKAALLAIYLPDGKAPRRLTGKEIQRAVVNHIKSRNTENQKLNLPGRDSIATAVKELGRSDD